MANTPELAGDAFAAEEVSRQIEASRRVVAERVRDMVGIGITASAGDAAWFRAGRRQIVANGKELVTLLSGICDKLYPDAPRVQNELINRNTLSSAAAAARMRLVERILTLASEPMLGLEAGKNPPEKSMYLSVLERGRLHRKVRGKWLVGEPLAGDDPLRLMPCFQRMHELLGGSQGARVPVDQILSALSAPPLGVRTGIAPLLIAVLIAAHDESIAVYENDAFLERVGPLEFQRLIKAPDTFSIQLCEIAGVRAAVFEALLRVLDQPGPASRRATLLDVVRPLCVFASRLPPYAAKTRRLSESAVAVRAALLDAREPATLLFHDLPSACGFDPFTPAAPKSRARVGAFAGALRHAIDELRAAYPKLLENIRTRLAEEFDPGCPLSELRNTLTASAEELSICMADVRLKGLCLRLADRNLPDIAWLEALGAFIASKPPSRWTDLDAEFFHSELARLVALYRRVQATTFSQRTPLATSVRIAVTFPDGTDFAQVVHLSPDEEPRAAELEAAIGRILAGDGRVAIAAASRAIRQVLAPRESTAGPSESLDPEEICT